MVTNDSLGNVIDTLIKLIDQYWAQISVNACGLWINKGWDSSLIKSKAFEITYLFEGEVNIDLGNKNYQLGPGSLYFSDLTQDNTCKDSIFKLYYISFETENEKLYLSLMECFKELSVKVFSTEFMGIAKHFIDMNTEFSLKRNNEDLMIKGCLLNILIKLNRYCIDYKSNEKKVLNLTYEKLVQRVMGYLNENYYQNIELKQLSQMFSISPRHLNYIFKCLTGNTIIHYLQMLRMEKAKRFLGFTGMNITEIALETGFCDCQHFCKVFKKHEGVTPLGYRNRNVNN